MTLLPGLVFRLGAPVATARFAILPKRDWHEERMKIRDPSALFEMDGLPCETGAVVTTPKLNQRKERECA